MRNQFIDTTDFNVHIVSVKNGFSLSIGDEPGTIPEYYVFQSQAELFIFLSEHFSFRSKGEIKSDSFKRPCVGDLLK